MIEGHPTLDAFLTVLQRLDICGGRHELVTSVLEEWALDPAEFGMIFFPGRSRRARMSVYRDSGVELVADYWRPGASTHVHDHGDGVCYTMILSGELTIDDYVIVERRGARAAHVAYTGSHTLGRGKVDIRASSMDLHRIRVVDRPAVSLHLHAGPLGRMTLYDPVSGRTRSMPMQPAPVLAGRFAAHSNSSHAPLRTAIDASIAHG